MSATRVAFLYRGSEPTSRERVLARALRLPAVDAGAPITERYGCYLRLEPDGLTLFANQTHAPGGLRVDFDAGSLLRRAGDSFKKQNLSRAAGLKADRRPTILDATAGLGSDAYLLARAGCELTLLERNDVVHALLRDGIERGRSGSPETAAAVNRMRLLSGDFTTLAPSLPEFDVVYLDPMFPGDRGSARAGKSMYLLQRLLGEGDKTDSLLAPAIHKARDRVVVKRAKRSPACVGRRVDICFRGSSSRYDVYLKR